MPDIDEDILRDLMHRSTDDLRAPAQVTAGILARHRRRRSRSLVLSVVATGAAAGVLAGVLASGTGTGAGPAGRTPAAVAGTIRLTAAQHTLYKLSSVAATTPRPAGKYVIMREEQINKGDGGNSSSNNIDVMNSLTGGDIVYQDFPGVPHQLTSASGTTQAQYDTWPTDPATLRAFLLNQAQQQQRQADKLIQAKLSKLARLNKTKAIPRPRFQEPPQTAADLVVGQVTDTLWNPLISPALRSALYKVLAQTPGVTVKTGVKDILGRPAVEISQYDAASYTWTEVFQSPATGATLQAVYISRPVTVSGGHTYSWGSDVYQSITRSNTIPPNPYH
jgi:outer membrane lipoprotein SlyB